MSARDELDLSDTESLQARSLKREMDRIGLSGLSEKQCFLFKDVIAKLTALSEEQLLAFKDQLAKLKSRMPIWRDLQEPPTLKQKKEARSKLRRSLDAIIRFERSGDKADAAIRDALGDHLDVAEWLAGAEKIKALVDEALRPPVKNSKRVGPVPVAPRARLIGMDLPNLYAKVFGRKFSPTRTLDAEFVQTCLALLGETKAGENFIRECVKLARKRARQQQGASARIGDHHRRIESGRGDLVATRSIRKVAPEALAEDERQRLKAAEDAAVESAAWATALVERGGSLFGLWLD
jgi:hypothetical protein